ncbi:hypothetical protein F4818DRAFT_432172 [Hypoxylon cercidicola]|nr:hypothetical protein F4818DRAFT_432172 [Hypoxylon cercidicola]
MLVNSLKVSAAVLATFLLGQAAAKTNLSGCVSSETVAYGGASLIWYVPDSGEICAFLDCGGGRAPPKTTVPGCAAYSGTATYTPSFLPGFGAEATASATGQSPAETSAAVASSTTAGADASSATTSALSLPSTITAAPSTTTMATSTTAESSSGSSAESNGGSSSSAGSSQAADSSSTSGTSSVSQAAAMPTAAVKGAVGMVVGLAAGVAML